MNIHKLKMYINNNQDKLPLSYNEDLMYKSVIVKKTNESTTILEKTKEIDHSLFRFYKSISRF